MDGDARLASRASFNETRSLSVATVSYNTVETTENWRHRHRRHEAVREPEAAAESIATGRCASAGVKSESAPPITDQWGGVPWGHRALG